MDKITTFKRALIASLFIITAFYSITIIAADKVSKLPVQEINGKDYYVYECKKGESVYGIAKKFNWDEQTIINLNPEVAGLLKKGMRLYYPVDNTNVNSIQNIWDNSQINTEESKNKYTVKKGESIYSIASEKNIPIDLIYALNPTSVNGVKRGDTIILPNEGETLQTITENNTDNLRNDTKSKELNDIKNSNNLSVWEEEPESEENNQDILISQLEENQEDQEEDLNINEEDFSIEEIKIALILDDPMSKKDIDFTRGALIGLSEFKNAPYKIDFKVIDGRVGTNNLMNEIEGYEPTAIISTAEKAFPVFLADYGNTNSVEVVNMFDLKNDLYEDNISIIQLMPPSSFFSQIIAHKLHEDNKDKKLLTIGMTDESDAIGQQLVDLFGENHNNLSIDELSNYEFIPSESVLIYSYSSKKEDITNFIKTLDNIKEKLNNTENVIVGRSNWAPLTMEFNNKFMEYKVLIPARVWLNEKSKPWISFLENYHKLFQDGNPVKSLPNFAASGYDIINYLLPTIANNKGDFFKNNQVENIRSLQTNIDLTRIEDGGGLINLTCCLLQVSPSGEVEKILVK